MQPMYKPDCLHFRGDVPCSPHKQHGVHCDGCTYYRQRTGRILIIKLGATGDVIRTSVLLQPLRDRYPDHEIWWLTLTPEVVPSSVHRRLKFTPENLLLIYAVQFNVVINLDKDPHACALMAGVQAQERYGFTLADGVPAPANALAEHKFVTGLFDDASQANTLSYPQEVLELCGFEWNGQEYELDPPGPSPLTIPPASLVVGLNTGCGDRWVSREWPLEYWVRLIGLLKGAGAGVVLLGGPSEHERNVLLRERTGALYEGTYPLMEFAAMINACDVVVSAVTMAMHMAIALRKRLVLMNNIFNPHEFELYGRGVLVQPDVACTCYFKQTCTNAEYRCMEHLSPESLFSAVMAEQAHL